MQIYIKNRTTGLFYSTLHEWTPHLRKARSFPSALAAWNFGCARNLGDTEIIFKLPGNLPRPVVAYSHFKNTQLGGQFKAAQGFLES